MASDTREEVKGSIIEKTDTDPELEEAFQESEQFKLEIVKENNRHEVELLKQEVRKMEAEKGKLGMFMGSQSNAASMCAIFCVFVGLFGFFWFSSGANADEKTAERILAVGLSALAYLFGKSQSSD